MIKNDQKRIVNDENMKKLSNHYTDDDESDKHIKAREVDSRA